MGKVTKELLSNDTGKEIKNSIDNLRDTVIAANTAKYDKEATLLEVTDARGNFQSLGDRLNRNQYYFNTVDLMKITNLKSGDYAITLGYYEANDDGGAEYIIVDDISLVEDNSKVHSLNNGLKAVLITDGKINVKQFGAKGDGQTDDTSAIQKALNSQYTNILIPTGTFMVSTLTINKPTNLQGVSKKNSIIKSIPNNTNTAILQIVNDGLKYSEISNLYIHGNKSNNSQFINGVQLYSDTSSDFYTDLHDLVIRFCSGNGLYLGTETGSTNMKEQRFYNIEVGNNDENGVYVKNATDGYFSQITAHTNIKSGFLINGGNHKIINCKAFWNGEGTSEDLETIRRIPSSAFTETSDTEYNPNKTYYTRTGEDVQNDWYEYVIFSGDSFVEGNTYYELTTFYQKRYAGFTLKGPRCVVTACEAQENFGDGFYTNTNNVNLVSILSDSNGLLIDNNRNMISYNSVNKTQLYSGVYINSGRCITIVGDIVNSRISQVGKYQLAPLFIRECNNVSYRITSDEMVNEFVMFQKCNMNTSNGTCNNQETIYEYDTASISFTSENLSLYSNVDYKSYIRKIGKVVYFKLTINDSTGNIVTDTNSRTLFYMPQNLRPTENTFFTAYLTNNNGNQAYGICSVFISKAGTFAVRVNEVPSVNTKGVYVQGCYVIK